jgi:hypothetical protein
MGAVDNIDVKPSTRQATASITFLQLCLTVTTGICQSRGQLLAKGDISF